MGIYPNLHPCLKKKVMLTCSRTTDSDNIRVIRHFTSSLFSFLFFSFSLLLILFVLLSFLGLLLAILAPPLVPRLLACHVSCTVEYPVPVE